MAETTQNNLKDQEFEQEVQNIGNSNFNFEPILNVAPEVREYQKPQVDLSNLPAELPQASFTPDFKNVNTNDEPSPQNSSPSEPSTFNPQLNDLSKSQKRIAAEVIADTAIDAYALLWEKGLTPLAQFDEKQLQKEYTAGTINPNLGVTVDANTVIPIKQYTKDFNEGVSETLKVSDTFKENVREPLIRICEKRGIGMTDEQKLAWEIAQDGLPKLFMLFSIKKDIKEVLENFRNQSSQIKVANIDFTKTADENISTMTASYKEQKDSIIPSATEESNPEENNPQIGVIKTPITPFLGKDILADMEKEAKEQKKPTKEPRATRTPRVNKNPIKK